MYIRIKQLRKKYDYTIEEVARRIGVKKSTYAGYETAYRIPKIEIVKKLATLYQASTDYIVGLTDNPQPNIDSCCDAKELFNQSHLLWDGIPLSEDELEAIRQILEILIVKRQNEDISLQRNEISSAKSS